MKKLVDNIIEFMPITIVYSIIYLIFTLFDDRLSILNSFVYIVLLIITTIMFIIFYGQKFWKKKLKEFSMLALICSYALVLIISSLLTYFLKFMIYDPFLPIYNIVFIFIFQVLFLIFYIGLIFKNYFEEMMQSKKRVLKKLNQKDKNKVQKN
ncbi:MAG: hypothetical protein KC589_08200 [Nanoarchaeota archaeon]|nr:hypothetical protein [Nanoarchaeota archaeon]